MLLDNLSTAADCERLGAGDIGDVDYGVVVAAEDVADSPSDRLALCTGLLLLNHCYVLGLTHLSPP